MCVVRFLFTFLIHNSFKATVRARCSKLVVGLPLIGISDFCKEGNCPENVLLETGGGIIQGESIRWGKCPERKPSVPPKGVVLTVYLELPLVHFQLPINRFASDTFNLLIVLSNYFQLTWIDNYPSKSIIIISRIYNCTKHGNRPNDNATSAHLHCTFWFYNCTNCDQLHVKICPAINRFSSDTFNLLRVLINNFIFARAARAAEIND